MTRCTGATVLRCAGLIAAAASPAYAGTASSGDGGDGVFRLLVSGPFVVASVASVFGAIALLALILRSEHDLALFVTRCADRLRERRAVSILWGLALALVIAVVGIKLIKVHALALLGVVVLAAGVCLMGLGLASAALSYGRSWASACDEGSASPLRSFGLGLALLTGASAIPFVGWLIALIATLSGIGAVADTLVAVARRGDGSR